MHQNENFFEKLENFKEIVEELRRKEINLNCQLHEIAQKKLDLRTKIKLLDEDKSDSGIEIEDEDLALRNLLMNTLKTLNNRLITKIRKLSC